MGQAMYDGTHGTVPPIPCGTVGRDGHMGLARLGHMGVPRTVPLVPCGTVGRESVPRVLFGTAGRDGHMGQAMYDVTHGSP